MLGGRVSQAEGTVGAQALRLEHSELQGEEAGGMGADHVQPLAPWGELGLSGGAERGPIWGPSLRKSLAGLSGYGRLQGIATY